MRAVIFDVGNVLVFHDNEKLFRELGARAGLDAREVERRLLGSLWADADTGRLDEEGIFASVCEALGMDLSKDAFFEVWSCHFRVHHEVLPLVEGLVGRVKLLTLSNTNPVHARYFRPRLAVLERFDHVLLSYEVGLKKPDPRFFQLAIAKAGVPPEEIAFFDDLAPYVEAARAQGLQGHLFTDAERFRAQLTELGLPVQVG